MLRPKDVTSQLGISAATLRLWSNHFEEHLSPSARSSVTEKGTPAQRRYVEDDVAVFLRAKSLLDLGLTYDQVKEKLEEPSAAAMAIVTNGALRHASESAIEAHNGYTESPALAELVALLKRQNELSEQILLALQTREPLTSAQSITTERPNLLTLVRAKLGF